ncbi:hypothetical protein AKJ16_DCAP25193 [Drosera capensis]
MNRYLAWRLGAIFSCRFSCRVEPELRAFALQNSRASCFASESSSTNSKESSNEQSKLKADVSGAEQQLEITSGGTVVNDAAARELKARPPRPKVNPGRGGQTN